MNRYICSDGSKVTQATIQRKLSEAYRLYGGRFFLCEGCGNERATDHSHIISQKRCKELHKTELIWSRENWFYACRDCHMIWESYKSGEFGSLKNIDELLDVLRVYDYEGLQKRLNYLP